MQTELEHLRQQLSAANARVAQLEQSCLRQNNRLQSLTNSLDDWLRESEYVYSPSTTHEAAIQWLKEKARRAESTIAALTERAEVRGKLAETFGEVLCQIAGTSDRVRACAIASDQFAAMKERAERAQKLYEAAKPLADMMSLAAFRSNPRMSDAYCPPMGGVKEYELRHQASAIRDAVEKYDTARREAGRGE